MNSPENHTISRSALRLLKWFCPDHLYEEIEGDLIQKFHRDVKAVGEARAKRRLIWNVIRFFRLEILLRNTFSFELNQFSMFQNYLKTTFRHLLKSKVNFIFKLGGLTLALFSFLVIAIYVSFQLSFDKYHQDYENIYRVNSNQNVGGNRMRYATVPTGIGQGLKNQFPEVRFFSRLSISQRALIKFNDKLLRTSGFVEADTSVFNIFSFKFIQGNKEALHRPGAIVLSQSLAKDIFGDEDPINKLIFFPEHHDQGLEVSAIVEDLPANTHLQIRAIHCINAFQKDGDGLDSWKISRDGGIHLYVRLAIGTSPGELAYKVGPFVKNNIAVEEDGSDKDFGIFFQPIADIYLGPVIEYEFCRKGNGLYVYLFCCLGVFLLVIASINYLNISIVDFHFRNREVGVRKVLGALKRQIALYITLEALFLCLLGLLVSFGCLYFFFPSVLMLLDSNLRFEMVFDSKVISLVAATIFLLVGFSTTYPAYHLAFNSPVNDLRGESIIGRRSSVGKSLLIVQFIISIVCVSATLIIGNQVRYIEGRDLGYNRHNLVSLIMPENYPMDKVPVLKNELSRVAGVESISFSYYLMTGVPYFKDWYNVEIEGMMKRVLLNEMFVDHDF